MQRLLVVIVLSVLWLPCAAQEDPVSQQENLTDNGRPYALVAGGGKGIGYAIAE